MPLDCTKSIADSILANKYALMKDETLKIKLLELASKAPLYCRNLPECSHLANTGPPCTVDIATCLANTRFINNGFYYVSCNNFPLETKLSCIEFKVKCASLIEEVLKTPELKVETSKYTGHSYTNQTSTAVSKPSKSKISTSAIIGIIFAVLVVIAAIGIGIYYLMKKRKEKAKNQLLS